MGSPYVRRNFIATIKRRKNSFLLIEGNARTGITHFYPDELAVRAGRNLNRTTGQRLANGIPDQVTHCQGQAVRVYIKFRQPVTQVDFPMQALVLGSLSPWRQ